MASRVLSWGLDPSGFTQAELPVTDRAFRYGMSVFETIARRGGRWLLLEEHLALLGQAAAAARFPFPAYLNSRLVDSLGSEVEDGGVLRMYLTAGDGGPMAPATSSRVYAIFEPVAFPTEEEFAAGYRLSVSAAPFPCVLGGWKTGNYWPHIQALEEARHHGCQEALLLNASGALISAAMANVFLVTEGTIRTPAPLTGARRGAVRAWAIEQCGAEETLLTPEDISRADECFITNSRIGVMPASEIDGRRLPERRVGEKLVSLYREQILRA